jgi:hypothetical protein
VSPYERVPIPGRSHRGGSHELYEELVKAAADNQAIRLYLNNFDDRKLYSFVLSSMARRNGHEFHMRTQGTRGGSGEITIWITLGESASPAVGGSAASAKPPR